MGIAGPNKALLRETNGVALGGVPWVPLVFNFEKHYC